MPSGGDSDATEYSLLGTQCGTNGSNPNIGATLGVVNINTIDPQLQTIFNAVVWTEIAAQTNG